MEGFADIPKPHMPPRRLTEERGHRLREEKKATFTTLVSSANKMQRVHA